MAAGPRGQRPRRTAKQRRQQKQEPDRHKEEGLGLAAVAFSFAFASLWCSGWLGNLDDARTTPKASGRSRRVSRRVNSRIGLDLIECLHHFSSFPSSIDGWDGRLAGVCFDSTSFAALTLTLTLSCFEVTAGSCRIQLIQAPTMTLTHPHPPRSINQTHRGCGWMQQWRRRCTRKEEEGRGGGAGGGCIAEGPLEEPPPPSSTAAAAAAAAVEEGDEESARERLKADIRVHNVNVTFTRFVQCIVHLLKRSSCSQRTHVATDGPTDWLG